MPEYRIQVRDRDLNIIGEIDTYIKLDVVIQHNQPGSWMLLIKSGSPQANLLDRGGGVVIWQEGVPTPIFTGGIESFQKYWTVEQHTDTGSVYVGGSCDNALAYQRLAFPDPSKPIGQQYTAMESRIVAGLGGNMIWSELDKALGSSALTDRRVPVVFTGTMPDGLGTAMHDLLRFDVIGSKLEDWCKNQGLAYRFRHNPLTKRIELNVFKPADKSKEIRFSPDLGNLREYVWMLSAPKVTRAIVACQGEGKSRYIYQKVDTASEAEWGFVAETFVDRRDLPLKTDPATGSPIKASSDVTDEDFETAKKAVIEAADTALEEGEKNGNFQVYPIDTPQCMFGRDYYVGDIVTVAVDGEEYADVIRKVTISVEDGGRVQSVAAVIGEQGSGEPLNLYKTVFEMREKLRKLEARM